MPKKPRPLEATVRQPAAALGPRAQATIERILAASREIFLTHGYGGTAIDDITDLAGVSRASFYTYFPSKRDVLLLLGSGATREVRAVMSELDELPPDWASEDLAEWVGRAYEYLDSYGSFGLAWSQAAYEDDELRHAGMKAHLHTCEMFGKQLNRLRGGRLTEDTTVGLLVFSMFERSWSQQKLYEPTIDRNRLIATTTEVIATILAR